MSLLLDLAELEASTVTVSRGAQKKAAPAFFAELDAALKEKGKAAIPAALWTTKNSNRYRKEFKDGNPGFTVSVERRMNAKKELVAYIVAKVAIPVE